MLRRQFLTATAALPFALPALAQGRWDPVADAADSLTQLHSLLIARNGETIFAEALRGPGLDRIANVKSVSKTLVATLLGTALDRGEIGGIDATLSETAPGLIPDAADPRVNDLTMEDLVTMRAGLERTSGPNYGAWVSSGNWVANALSRPFVAEPGGRMLYSTGSFHVLGAVLARRTDRSLLALARDRLGDPLGIEFPAWVRDPQGFYLGGNDMGMTPRGLLTFGEMVRQGGTWNGTQVVSRDWLDRSATPRTRSPWSGLSYGYGWFLGRHGADRFMLARGYGGQILYVSAEAGLTVAITSDPTQPARSGGYFGDLMDLIAGPVREAALA